VQHVIAALARRINGVQVEETPHGVFYRELTQAHAAPRDLAERAEKQAKEKRKQAKEKRDRK
jgi:hypothetical protein